MIPIFINIDSVSQEFSLSQDEVNILKESIVNQLTSSFYEEWLRTAGRNLYSSRNQYTRSLIVVDQGRFKGSVVLTNTIPNMIENGVSAFDMKKGFSNSNKIKQSKNGDWYLTIPRRFATPGALGENEAFSGKIPLEVYNVVKNKKTFLTKSGVERTKGVSPFEIDKKYLTKKIRPELFIGNTKIKAYENKSSQFEGATRVVDSSGKGQIMSFRRVSSNSDSNSWIHTGISARNLAEKALQNFNVDREVDDIVDNFLSEKGF